MVTPQQVFKSDPHVIETVAGFSMWFSNIYRWGLAGAYDKILFFARCRYPPFNLGAAPIFSMGFTWVFLWLA